jgi:hypothetical protein
VSQGNAGNETIGHADGLAGAVQITSDFGSSRCCREVQRQDVDGLDEFTDFPAAPGLVSTTQQFETSNR